MSSSVYTPEFYNRISNWSLKSAKVIVPFIIDLFHPLSVIDIGCGDGTWLNVFVENGIDDIFGIDGEYVSSDILKIPQERFLKLDINNPIKLNRKFDIAICFEVAEHLEKTSSEVLVHSITQLSDFVVFSAAIPYQPGDNHINPQWPEYWISLFNQRGYSLINSLKFRTWDEPDVAYFYKQNILTFSRDQRLVESTKLELEYEKYRHLPVNIIHPELFVNIANKTIGSRNDEPFKLIVISRVKRRIKRMKNYFITHLLGKS